MSGDWIKMRTDLYRDPKVCVMADRLLDKQGLLAGYVSQICQRDMTVTSNVMRNAVVGSLVTAWGIARHRGKRMGEDLVILGMPLGVIDDMVDVQGFGEAMAFAGWAKETPDGIQFPNFFEEFNAEPKNIAKSNAERQRTFRDRKKQATVGSKTKVTKSNECNGREEKRREEKSIKKVKKKVEEEDFQCWYSIYPRHVGRGDAAKAYPKAVAKIRESEGCDDSEAAELLLRWTTERIPGLLLAEPQFRPHPATWLNREQYRDDLAATPKSGKCQPLTKEEIENGSYQELVEKYCK